MKALADRIGSTEGQAWTLVIGFVLGACMLVIGIPPLLDDASGSAPLEATAPTATPDESILAPPTTPPPTAPTTSFSPTTGPNRSPSAFNPPAPSAPPTTRPPATTSTTAPATTAATTTSTTTPSTTTTLPTPLTVRDGSWTSASGGDPSVPDGGLPVAATLGQEDKRSFVRLDGTGTVLALRVSADGSRLAGQAAVRACRVTEAGWSVEPGSPPADGPEVDLDRCVDGEDQGDDIWFFDLATFPVAERSDDAGFALVAGEGGGPTFQVTFLP